MRKILDGTPADRSEEEFHKIMDAVRLDLSRGLSPAQVAEGRKEEFSVSQSTLYRWIGRGYAGMSNLDLTPRAVDRARAERGLPPLS